MRRSYPQSAWSVGGTGTHVKTILGDLTSKLTSWKGPAEPDATLLKSSGQLVIEGFITGPESRYGAVKESLRGLAQDIASTRMATTVRDRRHGDPAPLDSGRLRPAPALATDRPP
jgi:hypothetical protein